MLDDLDGVLMDPDLGPKTWRERGEESNAATNGDRQILKGGL
ncbi:MAG: hypothetical protein ACETWT_04100 [Thermodesulfobacteriota bacterium]